MASSNRVLRQCVTVHEAEIVRDRLLAAGVRAFVIGTDMATALSLGGAGTDVGVRLVVPPDDFDRAAELLAQDERVLREAGPWRCSRCDETNEPSFDVCWNCSKHDNPYRPVLVDADAAVGIPTPPADDTSLDDRVRRILMGSIIAMMLFPPASALTILMLLRLPRQAGATEGRKWQIAAALLISLIGLIFAAVIIQGWIG